MSLSSTQFHILNCNFFNGKPNYSCFVDFSEAYEYGFTSAVKLSNGITLLFRIIRMSEAGVQFDPNAL